MSKKIIINRDELYHLYVEQQHSIPELSVLLNIPKATIYNNIKRYDFKRRSVKESVNNKRIQNKRNKTIYEKYGVQNISQSENIKQIKQKKSIEKYGVANVRSAPEVKKKILQTIKKNYGINNRSEFRKVMQKKSDITRVYNKQKEIIENLKKYPDLEFREYNAANNFCLNTIKLYCKRCNKEIKIQKQLFDKRIVSDVFPCTNCVSLKGGRSQAEKQLCEFLTELGINFTTNVRNLIHPKEVDIFVPDFKIAIEYNGMYWHSDKHERINPLYHKEKTELCERQGIQLIQIWENDWLYKKNIVKSRLKNIFHKNVKKIHGRKCCVSFVSSKECRDFFDNNHLQGFVGAKYYVALKFQNEIIACASFGSLRKCLGSESKDNSYELIRLCNKINTVVIGSANKMFTFFIKQVKPIFILSYAKREWSTTINKTVYDVMGFKFEGTTKPNYMYYKNDVVFHRFNFRKNVLVEQGFDANKTEKQIMEERGFLKIHDVGNLKYVWRNFNG